MEQKGAKIFFPASLNGTLLKILEYVSWCLRVQLYPISAHTPQISTRCPNRLPNSICVVNNKTRFSLLTNGSSSCKKMPSARRSSIQKHVVWLQWRWRIDVSPSSQGVWSNVRWHERMSLVFLCGSWWMKFYFEIIQTQRIDTTGCESNQIYFNRPY